MRLFNHHVELTAQTGLGAFGSSDHGGTAGDDVRGDKYQFTFPRSYKK